ncbi:MAG: DNA methyltransferase, partial [Patescibacteria group bacterium]
MLKTFIFQTGHGKELAKAELDAVLKGGFQDDVFDGLVYEAEINHADILQERLGGTIRITEVLQKAPEHMPVHFVQWVTDAVIQEVKHKGGKIRFGLSMHPKSDKNLKKILINSKKNLKEKLGNLRFVNKDFQNLSSAQAFHENLITDHTIELHLFLSEKFWYLSKTLSIQNIEWYSHRDMNRPARDPRTGMFPPKLAQMLINLAQPSKTVYDPFCGSGTVLQEAWLMGYTPHGSDLEPRLVEDSI